MTYRKLKSYRTADDVTRAEIDRYIAAVPDPQTRDMFRLRFVTGLKYFQVAMRLGGGMSTDCVKKRIYRYVKNKQ